MLEKIKGILKVKKFWALAVVVLIAVFFIGRRDGNDFESVEVKRGLVREELILSGTINADEYAKLNFLSSGELASVEVIEGEDVKKGQILAKLDTTILYQTYLQAESDLDYYQAVLDRVYDEVKGHNKDESFSQRETRVAAENNKNKAYRAYVIAQKNLSNSTLRSPFDGVITNITHPFAGINTSLAESQIEVVNPKTIYFEVSADQSEVTEITNGQKVIVVLDSFSNEEHEGQVEYLSLTPKEGEVGAVYEAKVKFSDINLEANKFRIGMTGDAKFILSEKDNMLFIPPHFVNSDTNGKYLNLGKPNNKVYIETGLESEDRVEIKSDKIKEGDFVYD